MDPKTAIGRHRLFWIGVGALTLLTLILRTLSLTFSFDAAIGYFTQSPLLVALRVSEAVLLLLCFSPLILFKKDELPSARPLLSNTDRVTGAVTAITFLAAAVFLFSHLSALPAPVVLVCMAALFSVVAALYFIQILRGRSKSAPMFGYGVILAAVLLLSITYFDRYTQMNAPHKISLHLSMLSMMLYMLYEIRTLIACSKPRGLAVTSALCFFCTAVFGISNLIAFFAGVYTDPLYLMGDLVSVGFAACLASRTVGGLMAESGGDT